MSQTHLSVFSIIVFYISTVIQSTFSDDAAAAAAAAAVGYQNHEPIPVDPIIDKLAVAVAEGLLNSPVLGSYADFQIPHAHDMFFRAAKRFLGAVGIYDPRVAEIAAKAASDVGIVDSQLYFNTAGYVMAKFLKTKGVLSHANAEYLALRIVSEIELVACEDGLSDTETTLNAVVYGVSKVLLSYGVATYDDMLELFYLFAEEIMLLAGKVSGLNF